MWHTSLHALFWAFILLTALHFENVARFNIPSFPTFTLTKSVPYVLIWPLNFTKLGYLFHIKNIYWTHHFWKANDYWYLSIRCHFTALFEKTKAVKGWGKWLNVIELMRLSMWVNLDGKLSVVGTLLFERFAQSLTQLIPAVKDMSMKRKHRQYESENTLNYSIEFDNTKQF